MKGRLLYATVVVAVILCSLYFLRTRTREPAKRGTLLDSEERATIRTETAGKSRTDDQTSERLLGPHDSLTLSATNRAITNQEQFFLSLYDHPISFYGRVVDDTGRAIPGASVQFRVAEKPWESTVGHDRVTDSNGFVHLTGMRGASLSITATKEGYHTPEAGSITIKYDDRFRDRTSPPIPTLDAPAILTLKRKGAAERLVHLTTRSFSVAKDGTPLEINLAPPGMSPNILRVEAWIFDSKTNAAGQYDWRCSLSIPGGGFVERKSLFDFVAPGDGYQEYFEFAVFANAQSWRRSLQKEFFVRFNDNRFARVFLVLFTRGNPALRIESFLNPTPGSRNLEEDPAKFIEIPKPAVSALAAP